MTARQRELLAAVVAGSTAAELAARCGQDFHVTLRRLQKLEAAGYVRPCGQGCYRLTMEGEALRRRAAAPSPRPRRGSTLRAKPFKPDTKTEPERARHGAYFLIVRVLRCHLCAEGYEGPGHWIGQCALGIQGGHTAHHVGYLDVDGLIPGGGKAHDLYAGIAGRRAQEHFARWLTERGETLDEIGRRYVALARKILADGDYGDAEMVL